MSTDEARKVANAIQFAHDQCYICVSEICGSLCALLPEHDWYTLVNDAADHPDWVSPGRVD